MEIISFDFGVGISAPERDKAADYGRSLFVFSHFSRQISFSFCLFPIYLLHLVVNHIMCRHNI